MKIILTHEQADFDAVASLLGAWLVDPVRIPVLPKKLNRNLHAFINEYKKDFPFLKQEKAAEVSPYADDALLVDTQTISNTALINDQTIIRVIDHHQPRPNLPDDWQTEFDRTGACTTILIEKLMKKQAHLDKIHATFLLLGIYEDTGNLTYGSTKPRDLKAAAWLIENGADLNLINRYLNQPLTEPQQTLAQRLLQNCETHHILGQEIIIASADARDISDEFSTVAHHLRDMLSPDAIFILTISKAGIRIISRATNDRINVGQIMTSFNGGGHARAAAGLLTVGKDEDPLEMLKKAREELLEMLPGSITPPITVKQIMSTRPLLLDGETPLSEAAVIIQRYGYEGYPVISQTGELLGLLNRRSVERAQAFGLNPPIRAVMEAGTFHVSSADSIDYLKEMMNLSGWGQLPVTDPESEEIIGIVTRTDLIKTLTGNGSIPGNRNLAFALKESLPPAYLTLIRLVSETAIACEYPVYIVGGFVRDLLLNQPVMDFDIVVEGDAIYLAKLLVKTFGGKVRAHAQFGTAKWSIEEIKRTIFEKTDFHGNSDQRMPDTLDLISARTEFYDYPSAMPAVERSSIKLDLHRRDFTINTMAIRLDGKYFGDLFDYWGGYTDLQQRLIRVLHSLSFIDDPTRMLRAVRFEQRFNFKLEKQTFQLLKDTKPLLGRVSGKRILNDLELFFHEADPKAGMIRLETLGLLQSIHPALQWNKQSGIDIERLQNHVMNESWKRAFPNLETWVKRYGKYVAWWGTFEKDKIELIAARMQLPPRVLKTILAYSELQQHKDIILQSWPSEITFLLEKIPQEAIYIFDAVNADPLIQERLEKYLTTWRLIKPVTSGKDLKELSLPTGKWMADVLNRLRKGWIDEEFSSAEDEKRALESILPFYTRQLEQKKPQ